MLLEIALGSAAGYGLVRNPFSAKKKFIEVITPPAKTPLQKFKARYLDPFFGDSRQAHKKTLIGAAPPKISQAEKFHKNNVMLTTGALGVACVAAITATPALYIVSSAVVAYIWLQGISHVYYTLVDNHKIDNRILDIILLSGAFAGGLYFELAFASWFFSIIMYLIAKTEDHSRSSLVNLFGEQPRFVWRLVEGVEVRVPFEQVQIGDIVVVQAGEMIPVDGLIMQGTATIDQHMLTGEAQPVEKTIGDTALTATIILAGQLHIQVEKTGEQTVAAQITLILNQTTDYKQALQSRAMLFIDKMTLPVLGVSAITWGVIGLSQSLGVLFAYPGYRMIFLNPLSMLGYLHIASQKGILIKDGRSLEALDEIDTIVFDKTGTLTLDQPHVSHIHAYNGFSQAEVLHLAAMAEHKQSHPIAQAILQAAQEQAIELPAIAEASYQLGFGIQVNFNGQTIRVGSQRFMTQEGIAMVPELEAEQARCHAAGHSLVMVARDETLMGGIELQSTIRPEAQEIIHRLKARGLKLVIISGDHAAPTQHLAESLGIDSYYAQVLPEDKANLVTQLENLGHKVCFVGDGINDAIALKKATCSVSLRGATSIATDTAQIVLMDGDLDQLAHLFELAEAYNKNIHVNFLISVIPSAVYLGGAWLFSWPFATAILIQQSTTLLALYNIMRPLLNEKERE